MATGCAVDFSPLLLASCRAFAGREWLLDRAKTFLSDSAGPLAMVVLGDPGAGKTTVLARIAVDAGAPHFFCGRSDGIGAEHGGGWSEPIRCAETLGTQLVRTYGPDIVDWTRLGLDVRVQAEGVFGRVTGAELKVLHAMPRPPGSPIVRVVVNVGSVSNGGTVTGLSIQELRIDPMLALQELFLGPLRRAAQKAAGNVVVVIDGLDEWDRVACPMDVLEMVQRSALPSNIRVIASARPSYAPRLAPETLVVDISDPDAQNQVNDDIAKLIDTVLSRKGLVLEPRIRTDLIEKAGGNFLFASYLLNSIDIDAPAKSLEELPPRLEAFYRQELDKLVDQFAHKPIREALGPLLAVVCSAREPLDTWTAAKAADMSEDVSTDALERMRAFIRPVELSGAIRYAPFHLSFSDFVLSGRAGLGIAPHSGHVRLAERLAPRSGGARAWSDASDYAVRHTVTHSAAAGVLAMSLTRSLVDTPAYLVSRVDRLGVEALAEDLRYARQAGYEPPHLGAIIVELAMRAQAHQAAGISAAQGLATTSSYVGALKEAADFARLATDPVRALPLWVAGLGAATIAIGGFRCEGKVKTAALTAGVFLTLTRTDHAIEIWNLSERLRVSSIEAVDGLDMAEVEADGRHVWAASSPATGQSQLRRLSLPDGFVVRTITIDQRITALRTGPGGKHVAVGTNAGRVYLIDAATCQIVGTREVGSQICCLRFDGPYLAALTGRRKVVCWSLPKLALEGLVLLQCNGDEYGFSDRTDGLALNATLRKAIVGGVDGSVTELDLADEEVEPRLLARLPGWADHVALSGDGDMIAGDSTGRLHFIARDARRPMMSIRAHASGIVLVDALSTPGLTVTASQDGEIGLWNSPEGVLNDAAAHGAAVTDLTYSHSGSRIMSFGTDGSLIEWAADGRIRQRAYVNPAAFNCARLGADLNTMFIQKGMVQRLTLSNASEVLLSVVPWPNIIPDKCATVLRPIPVPFSISDNADLAAVETDAGLEVWSFNPPQLRLRFPDEQPAGRGALSGDGQLLVSHGNDGSLWLRSLHEDEPRRAVPSGGSLLCAPFWTSDGVRLLTHSEGDIRCIATEQLKIEAAWPMTADTPTFAVVTPDGNTVVVFGTQGQIEFRRRCDGQRLGGFALRPPALVAAFSPDGHSLAIGDAGGGVQVYRLLPAGMEEHGT